MYTLPACIAQLSELAADYQDEHSTSTQTAEMLEAETTERIRLEKEVKDLQVRLQQIWWYDSQFDLHLSQMIEAYTGQTVLGCKDCCAKHKCTYFLTYLLTYNDSDKVSLYSTFL